MLRLIVITLIITTPYRWTTILMFVYLAAVIGPLDARQAALRFKKIRILATASIMEFPALERKAAFLNGSRNYLFEPNG